MPNFLRVLQTWFCVVTLEFAQFMGPYLRDTLKPDV